MSILKIEPHERYTLQGMINYIRDEEDHSNQIIYYNTCYADYENPALSMFLIKQLNNKGTGVQYKQITLSLTEDESIIENQPQFISVVKQTAYLLAEYTNCQVAFAVHANTPNLHAHFIINSVRFTDGYKLQLNYGDLNCLKEEISKRLMYYGFSPIITRKIQRKI